MSRDYPTAYRRGSARHEGARLSESGRGSALDQAIRQTERNRRAEAQLREAIRETQRRHDEPGKTRVPKSAVRALKRGGRVALKRFPVAQALRAATSILDGSAAENIARAYRNAPIGAHGGQGTCPIVAPLDYSDIRDGLPSTACNTGQAVGPDYAFHINLGVGIWVKRAFAPNYNQLSWWLPNTAISAAERLKIYQRAGWVDAANQGMASANYKLDPVSNPETQRPEVGPAGRPRVHYMWDALAQPVTAYEPQPIPLTTELVTNRDGVGPGVANERSSWQSSLETQSQPTRDVPVAKDEPPSRGQKERKAIVGRQLLRLLSLVTEELDAVAAVYDCIPKALKEREAKGPQGAERMKVLRELGRMARAGQRGTDDWHALKDTLKGRGKVSFQEKVQAVYRHWDKIDLRCAAFNLLWERVEDAAYAKISQHSKSPYPLPGSVSGGRALEISRQGDAELPHGRLPLSDLKKWLEDLTGWRT